MAVPSEIERASDAALLGAPEGVPGSLYKDLAEAFKMFDLDGDGKICRAELGTILASLGEPLSESELEQMIQDVDGDGDGKIDLAEFVSLHWVDAGPSSSSSDAIASGDDASAVLRSAFDVFDSDNDGFISAAELHRVLSGLGDDQVSLEECRYMIRCVDADGDELVDFQEFQALMSETPARFRLRQAERLRFSADLAS